MAVDPKVQAKALEDDAAYEAEVAAAEAEAQAAADAEKASKSKTSGPVVAVPQIAVVLNPDFAEANDTDAATVSVAGSEPVKLTEEPTYLDSDIASLVLTSPAAAVAE